MPGPKNERHPYASLLTELAKKLHAGTFFDNLERRSKKFLWMLGIYSYLTEYANTSLGCTSAWYLREHFISPVSGRHELSCCFLDVVRLRQKAFEAGIIVKLHEGGKVSLRPNQCINLYNPFCLLRLQTINALTINRALLNRLLSSNFRRDSLFQRRKKTSGDLSRLL